MLAGRQLEIDAEKDRKLEPVALQRVLHMESDNGLPLAPLQPEIRGNPAPALISVFSNQSRTKSRIWSLVSCATQTPVRVPQAFFLCYVLGVSSARTSSFESPTWRRRSKGRTPSPFPAE